MKAFSEIYLLDLHGSSKKKETAPDGSKDENVFDIQQGVTLGIFVKSSAAVPAAPGASGTLALHRVYHAELWGLRESKYETLLASNVAGTPWTLLDPQPPFYFFVPQQSELRQEYERGWKLPDILPVNVLGFQTHRDHFAVDFDESALRSRIEDLRQKTKSDEELRAAYKLTDRGGWKLADARKQVREDKDWEKHFIECLYRPFDWRPCYFSTVAMDRPRRELLDHVARRENLCLLSSRQQATLGYKHAWVAKEPANDCVVSTTSREANQVFPLYLYPASEVGRGGEAGETPALLGGRRPNLNPRFITDLERKLGLRCSAAVPAAPSASGDAGATPPGELRIRNRGHLPHWEQEGGTYFVTFRLADSLPKSVLDFFEQERESLVRRAKQQRRELTSSEQTRLRELYSDRVETQLDSGAGACHLARPEIAELVAEALRRFDGKRYSLRAWCVMPNHVHVVFTVVPGESLEKIMHSWKSYTAHQANEILHRAGEFWQREYYDHLVRDEQELAHFSRYTVENPAKAHLQDWRWVWPSAGIAPVAPASRWQRKDAAGTAARGEKKAAETAALQFSPEDVFHYIYTVLHAPTYRSRYAEFLKSDFPRVPLTSDVKLFRTLCALGGELVALHLLESPKLAKPIARFPVKGPNLVEKGFPKYAAPGEPEPGMGKKLTAGRVYISKGEPRGPLAHGRGSDGAPEGQYFEGVPPEVWNFHIGGYQVCEKWLKDRRERSLSYEDLEHYAKVVTALEETIRLMAAIDAAIPKWPIE